MRYTVIWQPSAELELAEIWLVDADQARVAQSANEIERMLRFQPLLVGESRESNRRILIVDPLIVTYLVSEQDRTVLVSKIRRLAPKSR